MRLGIAAIFLLPCAWVQAQTSATLEVRTWDPQGGAVENSRVTLANSIAGYERTLTTAAGGSATFQNVPFNSYSIRVERDGFAPVVRNVALRSNTPVSLEVRLELGSQADEVQVVASEAAGLIDSEATGTRMELAAAAIEQMPVQAGTRGLESVLLSMPGFAADANGAIHPRGAHNQMTYVIDGMPISDQLTGSFGNAIDLNMVQAVELYTGNIPAEYGSKISGVAVITTPSGLGSQRAFTGSLEVAGAQFDTLSTAARFSGEQKRFGYFASLSAMRSHRFLDQVSFENWHNGGNAERAFTRLDYQAGPRDTLRLNLMAGRSSFELTTLRSQWLSGQDQRQLLRDFAASMGWLRMLRPTATLDATASYRTSIAQLFPSPGDTPVTASQARHLSNVNLGVRLNKQAGSHVLRGGVEYQRFPVSEFFTFGYSRSAGPPFVFASKQGGAMAGLFLQDTWKLGRWILSLGLRHDEYRFLVHARQLQPRLGVAYQLRETGTVLRASYNRTFQTPPNENLLLSSSAVMGRVSVAIRPERQNVYETGLEQQLGRFGALTAVYYHKDSRDLQDNDNFLNTGIIFPTSLSRARVNGAELRLVTSTVRGFSGQLSATHYHAVVTPPFTGGLFVGSTTLDQLNSGPFVIDHDQQLGLQGLVRYSPRRSLWMSLSVRYDSGLVSNPSNPEEVAQDPDYAALLPYVNLTSNPPRVRPRVLADLAVGYERLREGRRAWEISAQVTNLANTTALYNFQSVFVGTRIVAPRMAGVRFRCFF
jgi:hypothetical protein